MSDEFYKAFSKYQRWVRDLWFSFDSNTDHVARFILHDWEPNLPAPASVMKPFLQEVAGALSSSGDMEAYEVKAVCLDKRPAGENIRYLDLGGFDNPLWTSGYNAEVVAGVRTWILDIVFRPSASERSMVNVQKWLYWLKNYAAIPGGSGYPTVFFVGLLPLASDFKLDDITDSWMKNAREFWQIIEPFWLFRRKESGSSPTGFTYDGPERLNVATSAWAKFPPFLGTEGRGFARGSATEPQTLQPAQAAVASSTQGGGGILGGNTGVPISPQSVLSNLSTAEKVGLGAIVLTLVWVGWDQISDLLRSGGEE